MADQHSTGQSVTTSIDDLVKYLEDHGETDSLTLAKDLNVTEPIIETWANVLEKSNIVHISYKVGRMYVSKAAATPEEEAAIRSSVVERQGVVENNIVAQTRQLNDIAEQIDQFKKYIGEVSRVYKERAGDIKQVMDNINAYNDELNKVQGNISSSVEFVSKLKSELDAGIASLNEKAAALDSLVKGSGAADAQRLVDDMNAKIVMGMRELEEMHAAFEKQLNEQRKRFLELDEDIRREAKLLDSFVSHLKNEISDYNSAVVNYSKEAQSVKRNIDSESKRLIDEAAKTEQQAQAIYGAARKAADALSATLLDIKSKFPEIAKLSDMLDEINKGIVSAEAEKNELANELKQLSLQLESLNALKDESTGKKVSELNEIESKLKGIATRSKNLKKKSDEISDKTKRLGGK
ncbi:MAG: hypothetical protein QXY86_03035 [Candidatus Micrarchaeaceae archaeon]